MRMLLAAARATPLLQVPHTDEIADFLRKSTKNKTRIFI